KNKEKQTETQTPPKKPQYQHNSSKLLNDIFNNILLIFLNKKIKFGNNLKLVLLYFIKIANIKQLSTKRFQLLFLINLHLKQKILLAKLIMFKLILNVAVIIF